ncbi:MAG TPA: copper resistance protein CopC [Xanthobacteraceae bacterium]|nr:copper resistance protein CopC [Xanthobacteraceae bacterium]
MGRPLPDFASLHPGYGAVLLLLAFLGLLFFTQNAHAHAVLVETVPVDGAVVTEAPREVTLRFNEPVTPVMLRVVDVNAKPLDTQPRVENATIVLPLPPDLPNGTYVVSYRVISLDSHAIAGSVMFSVGDVAPASEAEIETGDVITVLALAAIRALFLAALLIAVGAILALWLIADFAPDAVRCSRITVLAADLAALGLGALLLGVAGCNFAGLPLSGLADADTWRLALSSSLAQSLIVAATGLVLMLAALPRLDHGASFLIAMVGSLMAIGSLALTGHAATAAPQWLMRWAVPLHALCAAFWLGALPLLMSGLRADPPDNAHRYAVRFSAYALVAVSLLLVVGVIIAVVQVQHLALLWRTTYGLVLVGKLVAVVLLLAVAGHNKWYATPLLVEDSINGTAVFIRAVWAEYLLFAAILTFTAMLSQIEPPRSVVARDTGTATGSSAGFRDTQAQGRYRVTLAVAPASAGHNAIAVDVANADGGSVAPREVALELSLPRAGIEPLRRQADRDEAGHFIYHGNDLVLTGRWHIEVHVLIDDFTKTIVPFDVPIR